MGIRASSPEKAQILTLLSECGFTDGNDCAVGTFANEIIKNDAVRDSLLNSFDKQKNAKGAIGLSTNANINTMRLVLEFWMDRNPSVPIPRDVKKLLQRSEPRLFIWLLTTWLSYLLIYSFFRGFERLEHDWDERIADGSEFLITRRIWSRFFKHIPAEMPRAAQITFKADFLCPPHGFPHQKKTTSLFTTCATKNKILDKYPNGGSGKPQWIPEDPTAWQFLAENFERLDIGDEENPVFAACFKGRGGVDYFPEEHPIGVAMDFFLFFLGLLVEGPIESCTERGRFAIQIRGECQERPALWIDNGHARPGFECLSCIFDKQAASLLLSRGISPHFLLRNPIKNKGITTTTAHCEGIFGSSKQFEVFPVADPICFEFERSNLQIEERNCVVMVRTQP